MVEPLAWQDRLARSNYAEQLRTMRATTREMAGILNDAAREAGRLVDQLVGDPRIGAVTRRAQYQSSRYQISQQMQRLWTQLGDQIGAGLSATADIGVQYNLELLQYLTRNLPMEWQVRLLDSTRLLAEQVESRLINNIPLSERVYKNQALSQRWVDREVNNGIALGRSAREIASSVSGLIRPDVRGGVSYAANRLGRTELNNAFHATTIRSTQQQPWVLAYKWNLSGSHPRPDECDYLAETDHDNLGPGVFRKSSVPGKPHPHCLCYLAVVQESEKEFVRGLLNGRYDNYLNNNLRVA